MSRPWMRRFWMRRYGWLCCVLVMLLLFGHARAKSGQPRITGLSGILMEYHTGHILYNKNGDVRREPASTTKILTAIVALEEYKGRLDDLVTISAKAASTQGSTSFLTKGQKVPLRELLYALMLVSGNDAATAIAEHVGGSVDGFAEMMNKKANQLGAKSSHFVNPSGLPSRRHYSTARDLAIITRHAYRNAEFRKIVATKAKQFPWGQGKAYNHNKLLWQYDGADGVKTGYTISARHCWVASAQRGNDRFISVVLGSDKQSIVSDLKRLLDYGFRNFHSVALATEGEIVTRVPVAGTETQVALVAGKSVYEVRPQGESWPGDKVLDVPTEVKPPITANQLIGHLKLQDGEQVATIPLLAANAVLVPWTAKALGAVATTGKVGGSFLGGAFIVLWAWGQVLRHRRLQRRRLAVHEAQQALNQPTVPLGRWPDQDWTTQRWPKVE